MADVNFFRIMKPGDRLSFTEDGAKYSSIIDEVTSETTLNITQPAGMRDNFVIRPGAKYRVICINDLGLHCFMARCIRDDSTSAVKMMEIEYTGNYSRTQNRQFYRCQISLPVEVSKRPRGGFKQEPKPEVAQAPVDWRSLIPLVADEDLPPPPPPIVKPNSRYEEGWIMTNTLDLSTGGVRIRLSRIFEEGDIIKMNLHVNKFGYDVILPEITGVIVRAIPVGDSTRDVLCGVEFLEIDTKARNLISKFIVACQRNNRSRIINRG